MNLSSLLSSAIQQSGKSRDQIADIMSEKLDVDISVHMINCWTAESKKAHRFPLEYLPAFCTALRKQKIIKFLLNSILIGLSYKAITTNEYILFDLFKDETHKEILEKRIKRKKRELEAKAALLFDLENE